MRDPMEALHNKGKWHHGLKSHNILVSSVEACVASGYFKGKEAEEMAFVLWAFVHGVAAFKIKDRLKMYGDSNQETVMYAALSVFNQMLDAA